MFLLMHKVTKTDENQDNRSVSTRETTSPEKGNTTIVFSLKNEVGSLVEALKVFQVGVYFKFQTYAVAWIFSDEMNFP